METVRLDLSILNETGTFVRVYAGGLTMFSSRASWKELGIPSGASRRLRYSRPPRLLVPEEIPQWFRNVNSRARGLLDSVGMEVDYMHPYRWIPVHQWREWQQEFGRLQTRWRQYREAQLLNTDRYEGLLRMLVEDFEQSACEAYNALAKAGEPDLTGEEEFVRSIVSSALRRMPSREAIKRRLRLEYFTPALVEPTELEEMLAEQQKTRLRRKREVTQERLRQQAEADAELAAMHRQRLAHLQQQAELMSAPLEQVMKHLKDEIEDVTQSTLRVLSDHGGLRGRSGKSVRNLSQQVGILEQLGEETLLALVNEAAALTTSGEDETDDERDLRYSALQAVLQQIRETLGTRTALHEARSLIAREAPRQRWRSICLSCRYAWTSEGSLEPAACPECKAHNVASREEEE